MTLLVWKMDLEEIMRGHILELYFILFWCEFCFCLILRKGITTENMAPNNTLVDFETYVRR